MKITIIGAGYVGAVTGTCLSQLGHEVTLVDKNPLKIAELAAGRSPISEPGLAELVCDSVERGILRATTDLTKPLQECDLVMVSVGTPTDSKDGSADLSAIKGVFEAIGQSLKVRDRHLSIAITSTVPPGTTNDVARPIIERFALSGASYELAFIPEFLREGSAISDFKNPTRFVIGIRDGANTDNFMALRPDLHSVTHVVDVSEAELLKTVENAWHATKVVFANEVGRIAKSVGVSGKKVMELLTLDSRQNISKTYLRPGFSFGGSCLPKDLRSFVRLAELGGLKVPLIDALIPSNNFHLDQAFQSLIAYGGQKIGILGLAFKADTDDLRESPALELVQRLLGRGYQVFVHDFDALKHNLYGANLETFREHSHIERIMYSDPDSLILDCDVIVLAQYNKKYIEHLSRITSEKTVIDLVGLNP